MAGQVHGETRHKSNPETKTNTRKALPGYMYDIDINIASISVSTVVGFHVLLSRSYRGGIFPPRTQLLQLPLRRHAVTNFRNFSACQKWAIDNTKQYRDNINKQKYEIPRVQHKHDSCKHRQCRQRVPLRYIPPHCTPTNANLNTPRDAHL